MSTIKMAWLAELLEQARFYRRNAAIRHGHPEVPTNTQPVDEPTTARAVVPGWLKAALAAALGAGSFAAGSLLTGDKPEAVPEVQAPAPEVERSLLQYLEDEGYHVP